MSSIVKATRAHYSALQHRQSPDRFMVTYSVQAANGETLTAGRLWCRGNVRGALTRTVNRLQAMYPEGRTFSADVCHEQP